MKETILMTFIYEYDEANMNDAVFRYREIPTERRYLDINLKLTQKRFAQNPKDSTKFAVVADYVSYELEESTECIKRKLPTPDKNSK